MDENWDAWYAFGEAMCEAASAATGTADSERWYKELAAPNSHFFLLYDFSGKWENCGLFVESVESHEDFRDELEAAFEYYGLWKSALLVEPSIRMAEEFRAKAEVVEDDETEEECDKRVDQYREDAEKFESGADFEYGVVLDHIREHAAEYLVDIRVTAGS